MLIEPILDVLQAQRIVPQGIELGFTYHLSRGESFSMVMTTAREPLVFVKASPLGPKLADEWSRLKAAQATFGSLVPKPLAAGETPEGLGWFATEALAFRSPMVSTPASFSRLVSGPLSMLLSAPVSGQNPIGPLIPNDELQQRMVELALSLGHQSLAEVVSDRKIAKILQVLPKQPQHGDLWSGNIALAPGRGCVVFDWEDYGKCELPGFDLYSLIVTSLGDFDSSKKTFSDVVMACFRAKPLRMTMEAAAFLALVPVYLLVFKWLKYAYGPTPHRGLDAEMLRRQTVLGTCGGYQSEI